MTDDHEVGIQVSNAFSIIEDLDEAELKGDDEGKGELGGPAEDCGEWLVGMGEIRRCKHGVPCHVHLAHYANILRNSDESAVRENLQSKG